MINPATEVVDTKAQAVAALAVTASVVSLVVSVLYIQGAPLNAAVADTVILAALLLRHWPSAELVGS